MLSNDYQTIKYHAVGGDVLTGTFLKNMIEREKKSLILRREHNWVGAHVTPYWMTSARDGLAPATLTL